MKNKDDKIRHESKNWIEYHCKGGVLSVDKYITRNRKEGKKSKILTK